MCSLKLVISKAVIVNYDFPPPVLIVVFTIGFVTSLDFLAK